MEVKTINMNDFSNKNADKTKKVLNNSKELKCSWCGKSCNSYINSHSVPNFLLKNIAKNGFLLYINTVINFNIYKIELGKKICGTFRLICGDCENKFKDYETPENYNKKPTSKMLTQIKLKNCFKDKYDLLEDLKNETFSKDMLQSEFFEKHKIELNKNNKIISDLKSKIDNSKENFFLGFYKELNYKVPIAYQENIDLVCDIEGNIINKIWKFKEKGYKFRQISVCIFPFKEKSVIMIFCDKKDKKSFRNFFNQLNVLKFEEQLKIVNYIVFLYGKNWFVSLDKKEILEKDSELQKVVGTIPVISFSKRPTELELEREFKKLYNYEKKDNIYNFLIKK